MNSGSLAPRLRDLGGSSPALRSRVESEYQLVRRLDAPGPGEQWLAAWGPDRQPAVVRIVPRDALTHEQAADLARDWTRASQMAPHRHLPPVLALQFSAERFVFATAQGPGEDLGSLVRQSGPLPAEAAADCMKQALAGLKHAHDCGVACGALKPCDLWLDFDGVLRIGPCGNISFATPLEFSSAVARDLRDLAIVFAWLLTGREASSSGSKGHAANGAARDHELRTLCPTISDELSELHARLACAGTADGFATAAEALAWLEGDVSERAAHVAASASCTCKAEDAEVAHAVEACCREDASIQSAASEPAPVEAAPVMTRTAEAPVSTSPHRSHAWLGWFAFAAVAVVVVGYLLWH